MAESEKCIGKYTRNGVHQLVSTENKLLKSLFYTNLVKPVGCQACNVHGEWHYLNGANYTKKETREKDIDDEGKKEREKEKWSFLYSSPFLNIDRLIIFHFICTIMTIFVR